MILTEMYGLPEWISKLGVDVVGQGLHGVSVNAMVNKGYIFNIIHQSLFIYILLFLY